VAHLSAGTDLFREGGIAERPAAPPRLLRPDRRGRSGGEGARAVQKNIMPPPPPEPPNLGFTTLLKIEPKRYSIPNEVKYR
jgi:hypothetical protein